MSIVILLLIAIIVLFGVRNIRMQFITRPVFSFFKKVLPPLSSTEKEAMEAGDIWWDGELFSGDPEWQKLHNYPRPQLSEKETAFIDNQVETLLAMLDGICMSMGSACNSQAVEPSHVLAAIGLSADQAESTIRISFGLQTSKEQVIFAANKVVEKVQLLRAISPEGEENV